MHYIIANLSPLSVGILLDLFSSPQRRLRERRAKEMVKALKTLHGLPADCPPNAPIGLMLVNGFLHIAVDTHTSPPSVEE